MYVYCVSPAPGPASCAGASARGVPCQHSRWVQGYLTHKKHPPPRTLQSEYT